MEIIANLGLIDVHFIGLCSDGRLYSEESGETGLNGLIYCHWICRTVCRLAACWICLDLLCVVLDWHYILTWNHPFELEWAYYRHLITWIVNVISGDMYHQGEAMTPEIVRTLIWQLLVSVNYMHSCHVWHRQVIILELQLQMYTTILLSPANCSAASFSRYLWRVV